MVNHVKVYIRHFDYVTQSEILCECCQSSAVDVHHINGRGKGKDVIENLMALCRKCHEKATLNKLSKEEMQFIHNNFLVGVRKIFIK